MFARKCHRLSKCKFSLALQSTKRPDHGNTCPSTGKAVGNASPEPVPAAQPRTAAIPDPRWALTSRRPRQGPTPRPASRRLRGNLSSRPDPLSASRSRSFPPGPRLPDCSRSAPASRLHSATSSLPAGLAAPPPPPRRPALGPPQDRSPRPPPPAHTPARRGFLRGPTPPTPRPELPPRAPHPQPPPSPHSAVPGSLPSARLPGGKGGGALHPGP